MCALHFRTIRMVGIEYIHRVVICHCCFGDVYSLGPKRQLNFREYFRANEWLWQTLIEQMVT